MHDNFSLEPRQEEPGKQGFVSILKYKGKPIATISWYHQRNIAAFILFSGTLVLYDDVQTCLDDLVMQTFNQRLLGKL